MWSNKANEFPLHNPKFPQNRNSTRDLTTEWDAFSQTKAALQHIENKLEVAPISIAGLESVMEKKPSISTTRKISKKDCRSSSQNKESCFRKPLRVTTLDSNVSKNGHVEFCQPLASFRDSRWSPSCKTSCQLEDKRLKYKEAGNKAEGIGMIYDKGEPDLHGRDLKSSSSTDETVVRYLNDHPAINALQSSDVVNPTKLEEEKSEESRGDEYTKISPSSIIQNELKELQLVESSTSSASTSSAHRLDILKQHQHDDKLEKLKERIRKQRGCPEELTTRGHDPEYSDYPITVAAPENIVTPKVRKVAIAPMAPSYKGFNPSEAKIRTPDGKVWCEEEFLNLSRELCRDLEFQLAEEDLPAIKIPTERKEKKGHKPVRKTQKIAQLSSPYFKSDGANTISTTSWRDGQRLAKKILGPVPKLEQSNTQILSSDRSEKDKFIKSDCRSSSQNKESCFRKPLRVTTLDSNVSKNGHVEFCQPLASFRDSRWSPSCKTSCQLEDKRLKYKEAGNKAEGIGMIYDKGEPDLHGRDLKSSSSTDETVVCYLNDHPAINALQSSDVVNPTKLEEEKSEESRGDEYTKISPSSIIQNELKELQLVESSTSSASTSSAHRLDILKQHQHDDKLEKLKERIRKQRGCPEELTTRGHDPEYSDYPITVAAPENIVTPKVRKVAIAPMAPSYKGFNPSEAKIRTPDGKVWCEEEFLNLSRELCRDLEFQLAEEDLPAIKIPTERKEKKGHKPVRKTQKIAQLSSPYFKSDGANTISTTSWRDGQRLAKKILGPVPKLEQSNTQILSSDRSEKDKFIKSVSSAQITETDCNMPVAVKPLTKCPERSWSKIRAKNNLKKKDAAPLNGGLGNDRVNKDFLPVEIRGILDDLQLDSVVQDSESRNEECQNQESEPSPFSRSHSPSKKKSDKVPISEDTQFILKKRHYDADEVRQYIMRQQEERKKRQSEEKKAQKEATEQKNKRLKELYKKQKEAVASKTKTTSTSETVTKQLQETYSKLFLEQTLLENPALSVQEVQSKPGYQPSGESDKENKAQERPVSASSSSDMSLSEPFHPLIRDNTLEPLRIHPEKLNSVAQVPCSKSVLNGALFSQLLSLDNMGILQKDFESVTSSRRSHNTAMGSLSSTPQPFMSSTVQPTINHYKHKLDRIEALKATAASLSNRIESEAKKLAGAGINYEAAWDTEHDLLQRDQGDTCWAKASSPPVREDDVFSARLQKMLATCNSHTTFDDNLPGVGNLHEFKKLPETISPHAGALGLPGNNTTEGILGNPSQKQACPAGPENKPAVLNDSGSSLSEGLLSTGFLSEEEGEKSNNPPSKIAEALNEKEFCVADQTGFEPIKEFQKEAENYLPIFTQIRNGPKPWEELVKGSPHSVINIFVKSYQLCGKESEEHAGQGPSTHRPLLPATSPPDSIASYEDEFISSQGSGTSMDKKSTPEHSGTSSTSLKEELASKKLPYEHQTMELTHHSSRSPSSGSSRTSTSSKRRGRKEKTESLNGFPNASLREESKVSPGPDYGLEQAKHLLSSNTVSSREQEVNPDSDNSLEELSGHSLMSLPDKVRSPRTISSAQSPNIQKKMDPVGNTAEKHRSLNCPRNIASGSVLNPAFSDLSIGNNRTGTNILNGSMRFSPAGLQHRMSAELNYLSTIEESIHQIFDIERVRGISLAQQESVSLALILKSQQQRHERDLTLLKLKAEQELLENQRNLEEAKQKAAQAHAESLHHLAHSHQEAAETLQETISKIATHQLETALLTADTARQIREMTELARFQISDAVGNTAAPVTTLFDQEQKHNSAFIKQLKLRNMNRKADSITTPPGKEETSDSKHHDLHAFDSYSESSRSKAHYQNSSSSRQESPSSKEAKKLSHHEKPSSSIEDEAPTAMNDSLQNNSIPSVPDERDSTSIATEYSLKFDESMTEDEIEEQSFRSLLPSESHRRINLKKRSHQVYSDEEASPEKSSLSPIKELNLPFSGGQDSFSKFTMEMVRQYMRGEEMRAAHQSSLLRLREKALKEKTKAELAWLEHQKRHLRDKGEDDKMPPIRKKQRGLLLKLQQEKAEIKRLQEANKAARKERQLILKQQEEIERIRQTTMKLQEKLKFSGKNKEHRSEDDKKQTHSSSPQPTDAEAYSPSSISSSDTSSIMQKLKKMRRRMDEKSETSKSWKSLTDSERSRGSLESIAEHIDVVPSSEQSVSVNIMKFTEAEIQSEKQSHMASAVLKTLRKSTAESDDLDSLLSSAILKDLGNTSKISPTSLNKTEDAVSYDPQATRSIVQETAESKELEVEIASRASEISDASVFDLNQNNSISLKTEVPPETELSEKDQFVLECISVQGIKEMPSKRFKDDESISVKSSGRLGKDKLKGDSLISEQISICEEPSYSNDFEESFLRTDVSKSEIVLTEYQRDTFYASTLSFKQGIRSQGEKSLYTRPGSESPSFGSDDEISECLSENSLSVADSIHSERLLELKSPTEFVKNKECGYVEKVPADDGDDSLSQASSFKASSEKQEEDFLLGFSIGDRVLVSNVQPGTLKFKGRTNFAKGFWAGVELDEPEGNNNGSYNDIQYFDCKEKHGIFAPSQKISHFPESFGNELDSKENSFFNRELDNQHKTNQKGLECLEEEKNKRNSNEKSPRESSALKGLIGTGDYVKFNKSSGYVAVINTVDEFDQETGDFDSPKSSKNDNGMLPSAISNIHKEDSAIEVGEILDSSFPEKWKQQSVWQEQIENRFSPTNLEKSATPLLDLLTKERSQLEAQLKVPSQEKEDLLDRQERVGLLADSLLQGFVKDTVSQFQQIRKARNEKIHFSNQELGAVQEKKLATNEQQRFLVVYELDDGEELSSPDMCPRPESPVFGASGQEELAKRLAELELSREFLNVLGDDQDWFDEDFGLSSHTLPQNQAEESAVLPKIKLPKVSPKPYEEPLAVPYVAEEVEELVHAAAEKLWKCKELGHDLQALSNPRDMNESPQNDDIETVSKEIYKQAVFDLTREIFEEIFAEDPNLNQPLWMKPSRIISGYFRRVKDPSDLEEIKVFITTEVLKLLNLRKESNNKTDWQKMIKFGRKKKDRVGHILVQELHEEEAQWVNYDEDELYVKMQLADGIFEALIRETNDLLNQITEKQKLLLV